MNNSRLVVYCCWVNISVFISIYLVKSGCVVGNIIRIIRTVKRCKMLFSCISIFSTVLFKSPSFQLNALLVCGYYDHHSIKR